MSDDIQEWCERLEGLLGEMPRGHWIFVASGTMCVLRYGEDGKRVVHPYPDEGMDQDYMVWKIVADVEMDGGDW